MNEPVHRRHLVSNNCVAIRFQIRFDVKEKEDEVLLGLTQKTGRGDETVDKKTTIGFTIVRVSNFNVFGFFSVEKKVPSVILVIIRFCICGCANSNNSYTPSSFFFFVAQSSARTSPLDVCWNFPKTSTKQLHPNVFRLISSN